MRQNKEPTVIFTKKYEQEELFLHCKFHRASRMYRMSDGSNRCQICGGVDVATRTVYTTNPSSLRLTDSNKKK